MPLTAIDFVPKGPVKSADLQQFYNLFTGVMLDQPVTFKNVLTLGGNQGTSTVPLKLYGAIGQTGHLLDLYADTGQAQPGFGFGATGAFGWGPGGASPQDTFLSRVATQNGHATDTAGLLIQPYLEVAGNISATTYLFPNSATLTGPVANPLQLVINQDLTVNRNLVAQTVATNPNGGIANQALGSDVARANLLTNGGFEIWQRGNGPFTVNGAYTADRWQIVLGGGDSFTVTREASVIAMPGSAASMKVIANLPSGFQGSRISQYLTDQTPNFKNNQTVSISFAVWCNTPNAVQASISDDVAASANTAYHPGDSQWHTLTATVVLNPNAIVSTHVWVHASCTAYVDNACLVFGSQPANYVPLHPADELARCLRYYQTAYGYTSFAYNGVATAAGQTLSVMEFFSCAMGGVPTVTKVGTSWPAANCSQPTISVINPRSVQGYVSSSAAGAVSWNGNATNYWTAEVNP